MAFAVRMIRHAISPRLAMRMVRNGVMPGLACPRRRPRVPGIQAAASARASCMLDPGDKHRDDSVGDGGIRSASQLLDLLRPGRLALLDEAANAFARLAGERGGEQMRGRIEGGP